CCWPRSAPAIARPGSKKKAIWLRWKSEIEGWTEKRVITPRHAHLFLTQPYSHPPNEATRFSPDNGSTVGVSISWNVSHEPLPTAESATLDRRTPAPAQAAGRQQMHRRWRLHRDDRRRAERAYRLSPRRRAGVLLPARRRDGAEGAG